MNIKRCWDCKEEKPIDDFVPSRLKNYDYQCRACVAKYRAKYTQNKENLKKVIVGYAKDRAAKSNIEFDLTYKDIDIPDKCPILNIDICNNKGLGVGIQDSSPSLDRIDPTKGYVPNNIQIISWRANKLKNNASLDELIAIGSWASKTQNNTKNNE